MSESLHSPYVSLIINSTGYRILGQNLVSLVAGTARFINLAQETVSLPGLELMPLHKNRDALELLDPDTRRLAQRGKSLKFSQLPPCLPDLTYLVDPKTAAEGTNLDRLDFVAVHAPNLKLVNLSQGHIDYTEGFDEFFESINPDPGIKPYVVNFDQEGEPNNFTIYDAPVPRDDTLYLVPWRVALVARLCGRTDLVGVEI